MTTIMVTIHWYGNKYGNQYDIDYNVFIHH